MVSEESSRISLGLSAYDSPDVRCCSVIDAHAWSICSILSELGQRTLLFYNLSLSELYIHCLEVHHHFRGVNGVSTKGIYSSLIG